MTGIHKFEGHSSRDTPLSSVTLVDTVRLFRNKLVVKESFKPAGTISTGATSYGRSEYSPVRCEYINGATRVGFALWIFLAVWSREEIFSIVCRHDRRRTLRLFTRGFSGEAPAQQSHVPGSSLARGPRTLGTRLCGTGDLGLLFQRMFPHKKQGMQAAGGNLKQSKHRIGFSRKEAIEQSPPQALIAELELRAGINALGRTGNKVIQETAVHASAPLPFVEGGKRGWSVGPPARPLAGQAMFVWSSGRGPVTFENCSRSGPRNSTPARPGSRAPVPCKLSVQVNLVLGEQ
ncbi:hypothetical protein CIHG_02433 [Coccidioides immitis H538.4]|uniref:Uncharacterized protein n=3 Tax=Coccidioides immitis TaxID=5501 RepID=A0A0J8RCK9_COCIT|nr:hypothetical protein CIRG_00597 [Coccidioides immitis RMSCC 2394]KMU81623.1 hypothetical protein CISG_09236 [Coccidioides immitis RMSCC 3703]KMU84647.1 hypothetical protein CIHG_02433 [Coccidioides immitis H538.4]